MATLFLFAVSSWAFEKAAVRLQVPFAKASADKKGCPDGWSLKDFKGQADIEVLDTEIGKTLHMKSRSASTAVMKELSFDPRQYPVINWQWMARRLPSNADARKKGADDQAIQLYVVFPYKWPAIINNRIIGYIWDTSAPVGALIPKSSNVKYIVLKSGADGLGKWFPEKRNVYNDYKRLFNEEPLRGVVGISVMIDSDDTKSSAESYIGAIYLARE